MLWEFVHECNSATPMSVALDAGYVANKDREVSKRRNGPGLASSVERL